MSQQKIRILVVTDSAVLPSGMAETTRLVFENLLALYPDLYEIHQIGWFHCYAVTEPKWPVHATALGRDTQGRPCFDPADRYAQRTFFKLVPKLRPDIVFVFGDPQMILPLCTDAKARRYRLVLYLNFDGLPFPPDIGPILDRADSIVGTSQFSTDVIRRYLPAVDVGKLDTIYSPADTHRFAPVADETRIEMRKSLLPNWMPPEAFVLGWVGRNQWRKQVWLLYKTLSCLRKGSYLTCDACGRVTLAEADPNPCGDGSGRPMAFEGRPGVRRGACSHCGSERVAQASPIEDLFLWAHMTEEPEEDWPLRQLEQQYGVRPDRDIYYTPGHAVKGALSPEDMPTLYDLWDGLLYLSGGEGFGLPAWEAMCAGLPVVYTNYSAHAEYLSRGNAGLPVGGVFQPERRYCVWRMIADVPQVIEAVRRLYFDRRLGRMLGANGRAFVEAYHPQAVVKEWHELFRAVMASGHPSPGAGAVRRHMPEATVEVSDSATTRTGKERGE